MRAETNIDRTLILLLGAGLVARLVVAIPVFLDISRTAACYDAVSYDMLASRMLEGKPYSVSFEEPYKPNSTITPGYPVFLAGIYAVTGGSKLGVVLVQILLNLLLLFLLYRFIKRRFGERAATWMGIFYILDLNLAMFSAQLTADSLFAFVLTAFLIVLLECFERQSLTMALAAGVLLGAATLVKPIALYFGVPLLLFVFLWRFSWRKLAGWGIVLGLQLFCITPWVIRNRVVFGETFYTTISDVNLLRYHAAPLKSMLENIPREEAEAELEREGLKGRDPNELNEAQAYLSYGRGARGYLIRHPLAYASSLLAGGLATLVYPLPMAETGFYFRGLESQPSSGVAQRVLMELVKGRILSALSIAWKERLRYFGIPVIIGFLLYSVFHFVMLAFGLRAYVIMGFKDKAFLLFLLAGMYFLGLLAFGISPRMRVPVEPLLAGLAAVGLVARREKKKHGARNAS